MLSVGTNKSRILFCAFLTQVCWRAADDSALSLLQNNFGLAAKRAWTEWWNCSTKFPQRGERNESDLRSSGNFATANILLYKRRPWISSSFLIYYLYMQHILLICFIFLHFLYIQRLSSTWLLKRRDRPLPERVHSCGYKMDRSASSLNCRTCLYHQTLWHNPGFTHFVLASFCLRVLGVWALILS